jgi:hypothetical protein
VRLAWFCNSTALELLFLPEELLEVCTADGALPRENRSAFLSDRHVRSAYGGYALSRPASSQPAATAACPPTPASGPPSSHGTAFGY